MKNQSLNQTNELQAIVHEMSQKFMSLVKKIQVVAFINKLPPSWKEFGLFLKHKRAFH